MSSPHRPKTIYLHIGFEKTGTTSLQMTGLRNRAKLAERGVLFSRVAGNANHIKLPLYARGAKGFATMRLGAKIKNDAEFDHFVATFQDDLKAEFEHARCDTVWLTCEHLSTRLTDPASIAKIKALLSPLAERIRVVVYLRHQPELYLSSYSQRIRAGQDLALDDRRPGVEDYYFRFDRLLEQWGQCFGRDSLVVRVFDRHDLKNGDIVEDFLDVLGITREGLIFPRRKNPSLDSQTVQFLQAFHRYVPRVIGEDDQSDHGDCDGLLGRVSTYEPITVPGAVMREIAETFEPSNRQVALTYFGRPDGKLFREKNYDGMVQMPELNAERARDIGLALCNAKFIQIKKRAKGAHRQARRQIAPLEWEALDRLKAATTVDDAVRAASEVWLVRQRYFRNMPKPAKRVKAPENVEAEA